MSGALLLALASLLCLGQERFPSGEFQGFTKSPGEHIINHIEKPITARVASGVIVSKADSQPLQDARIKVRGPGAVATVRGGQTDAQGRFKLKGLRPGEYDFKVTRDGFQSAVGKLIVIRSVPNQMIRIELAPGV